MEIRIAGCNVDLDELEKAVPASRRKGAVLSPETLSAAYARISRYDLDVGELRRAAAADVARAQASNSAIVFDQGHASVAEHAVFNVDVTGISRLALEELEAQRFASFTEKSQRYVRLGEEWVRPRDLPEALLPLLAEGVRDSLETHGRLVELLRDHWRRVDPPLAVEDVEGAGRGDRGRRRERIREDARYAATLAATGQVGMTINARAVEAACRRMAASPLAEVRDLAAGLANAVRTVAPSLIRYADATPVERWRREPPSPALHPPEEEPTQEVRLLDLPRDGDLRVASALLVERRGGTLEDATRCLLKEPDGVARLLGELAALAGPHDAMPRAFELVHLTFELVCSAACFAQLKRHRVATIISGPYEPALGITVPPAVRDAGAAPVLEALASRAVDRYHRVSAVAGGFVGAYALLNAHRRRVLFSAHLRELVHLSRLRLDGHAQWDIRALAGEMCRQVRETMPLAGAFLAGKDGWGGRTP